MSYGFKFERGQKLTRPGIPDRNCHWLKGLHCEVLNRVYDVDAAIYYYVVHEYLRTDNQPQGEKELVQAALLEKECVPWIGYDAWNKLHNTKL